MQINISVTQDGSPADRLSGVRTAAFEALRDWGPRLQRYVADTKITSGGILEPRTGNLRRSLFSRYEESGDQAVTTVGADLGVAVYARIQEYGGTVTGQAHKLTIPVGEALTDKGVARFTAPEVIANPQSFGFDSTFSAKGIIFGRIGKITGQAQILPLFILKDSVTLPPREYLSSSLDENLADIEADLQAAVDDAVS